MRQVNAESEVLAVRPTYGRLMADWERAGEPDVPFAAARADVDLPWGRWAVADRLSLLKTLTPERLSDA